MASSPRLVCTIGLTLAMTASAAIAGTNCTCRYKGIDIPEGQTICMELPSGNVLATCGRVLNNTSWKTIQKECPYGMLDQQNFSTKISAG